MHLDCKKLDCVECCKRYWITVLPSEAKAEAVLLNSSLKDFLEQNCVLHLQLFPSKKSLGKSFVSKNILQKKVLKKLEKTGKVSEYFLALPSIAFKRSKKECIFLNSEGLCEIYEKRPKQCALFPFISLNENKNFLEKYSFCKALKNAKFEEKFFEESKKHYVEVKNYFEEIEKKGFKAVWNFFPKNGIVLFKAKFLCKISEKKFFKVLKKSEIH